MQWAILGTMFKIASWAISFVFIAKGAMKPFLFNEISIKIFHVPAYLLGFYYWGLDGLGIAFMLNYLIYLIIVYTMTRRMYSFRLSKPFIRLFSIDFLMVMVSFIAIYTQQTYKYAICIFVFLLCMVYTYKEMNKRIALPVNSIINKFVRKKNLWTILQIYRRSITIFIMSVVLLCFSPCQYISGGTTHSSTSLYISIYGSYFIICLRVKLRKRVYF